MKIEAELNAYYFQLLLSHHLHWGDSFSIIEGVKEKTYAVTLVKDGKADFIKDRGHRFRDHCNGISQWGIEIVLNY